MVTPKFRYFNNFLYSSNEIWRKLHLSLYIFPVGSVFVFHGNNLVWENMTVIFWLTIKGRPLMFLLRMLWSAPPIKTHCYASHSTWPEAKILSQIICSLADFNLTNNSSRAFMFACKTGKMKMLNVLKSISCTFLIIFDEG